MAYQHHRTQAILLRAVSYSEADRLFLAYTKEFGRVEVLGKSIRKITSKLGASSRLFSLIELEFIQGKSHKIITDTLALDKFNGIRQDLKKLAQAQQMAHALASLAVREEKDEKVWQLLIETFSFLEQYPANDSGSTLLVYFYFLWKLLVFSGYTPELYFCPVCSKRLTPEIFYFIPQEGGLVCGNCSSRLNYEKFEKEFIRVSVVKLMRILIQKPIVVLARLKVGTEDLANLAKVSALALNSFQHSENEI